MDTGTAMPALLFLLAAPLWSGIKIPVIKPEVVKRASDIPELTSDPPSGGARARKEGLTIARLIAVHYDCVSDWARERLSGRLSDLGDVKRWGNGSKGIFASVQRQIHIELSGANSYIRDFVCGVVSHDDYITRATNLDLAVKELELIPDDTTDSAPRLAKTEELNSGSPKRRRGISTLPATSASTSAPNISTIGPHHGDIDEEKV